MNSDNGPHPAHADDAAAARRARILLINADEEENAAIRAALEAAGFVTYIGEDPPHAFEVIYNEPPNAVILDCRVADQAAAAFATDMKGDNVFSHLPIVGIVPADRPASPGAWEALPVDEYLPAPVDLDELLHRLRFTLARMERERGANPLTRLPGNDAITRELQRRIDERVAFALVYIDVDNFKAFNDTYGFSRGDEVLRMIARVLVNAIRPLREQGGFVGHVGGDDFVLAIPLADMEGTCAQIIANFDLIVPTFYNEEDRTRGYIDAKDRQGRPMRFPLMTLTLAVVPNEAGRLHHYGEASAIAAELKKIGKQKAGSNYVIDRRRMPHPLAPERKLEA